MTQVTAACTPLARAGHVTPPIAKESGKWRETGGGFAEHTGNPLNRGTRAPENAASMGITVLGLQLCQNSMKH